MALWDIVRKYYGVLVYQFLDGKFHDTIRCYPETDKSADPAVTAARLKQRMTEGFTFLKMDFIRARIREKRTP
jgi:L-alanine-DL-glutamate epimerase-like enolase superfamily enzyme